MLPKFSEQINTSEMSAADVDAWLNKLAETLQIIADYPDGDWVLAVDHLKTLAKNALEIK